MKPYKTKILPIEIEYNTELVRLLGVANKYYGEALGAIRSLGIDKELYISSLIRSESYKSTQIEGTNVSQSDMFAIDYVNKANDEIKEILNYSKAIEFGYRKLQTTKLSIELLNELHKMILDSVRGNNKNPGKIREVQNWIGPRGLPIESGDFIPPVPEDVKAGLLNLMEYFYNEEEDSLITAAIFHAQFETIHPYNDGNGRLGRLLIPLQVAILTNEEPILFLSELIEQYKPSYGKNLNDFRKDKEENFIIFFLQCIIDQSRVYIHRTTEVKKLIMKDREIVTNLNPNNGYKLYELLVSRVVVNSKLLVIELGVTRRTANNYLNKLIEKNIVVKINGSNNYVYMDLLNLFNVEY